MKDVENRFGKAVEQEKQLEEIGERYFKAAMDLGKEIANKGAKGIELSKCEKDFIKSQALFILQGMLSKRGGAQDA